MKTWFQNRRMKHKKQLRKINNNSGSNGSLSGGQQCGQSSSATSPGGSVLINLPTERVKVSVDIRLGTDFTRATHVYVVHGFPGQTDRGPPTSLTTLHLHQ